MGINAEMIKILIDLRKAGMAGGAVVEIGAQDVCAVPEVISHLLSANGVDTGSEPIRTAPALYRRFGFERYVSIDATASNNARAYDLNRDLAAAYGFSQQFELVTNLGTAEHCFNQQMVFKNLHDLCRAGGLVIHAVPAQGNVNHGFYSYHPRFFADLAVANNYEVLKLAFTVNYTPALISYNLQSFKDHDAEDLLFYAVLRRTSDRSFQMPFDGMFGEASTLPGYAGAKAPLQSEFAPYLKRGSWEGTKGWDEIATASDGRKRAEPLAGIPARALVAELARRLMRRLPC